VLSSLGEAEFYPGETCESDTAAGDCDSRTSRLFSAFQFFDHSGMRALLKVVGVSIISSVATQIRPMMATSKPANEN